MTNWLKAYTVSGFPCSADHLTAFASIVITIQNFPLKVLTPHTWPSHVRIQQTL